MDVHEPIIFTMPLHIPGPNRQRNDTDVYLQLLTDELKNLWLDGLEFMML